MRGSVVTRRDANGRRRYYAVVDEYDGQGKRRRRWRTDPATGSAFTNRKAAEDYAARLVVAIGDGTYAQPNVETSGAYLDTWLITIKPTVRASTWHSYEKNIRLHVKPYLGARPLVKVSALELDRLYAMLLESGRRDGKPGGLSPRTVSYVAVILGRAFKDAHRKGLVPRDPTKLADKPRSTRKPMTTWTPEQAQVFLASLDGHRFGALFAFLMLTGVRRGDALGQRWADIDIAGRRSSIVQTVTKIGGKVVMGPPKSGVGRTIALDTALVDILTAHRIEQAKQRLLLGAAWRDNDLVFPNEYGDPQYPETVARVFVEHAAMLGLPRIRLHDIRHGWASTALAAGIHPKVVQERLGHSSISVTMDIYSHVAPTMHEHAAEAVSALLRGGSVDGR